MALSPGARLGAYEIASALGVGGMGEVYRATDTRLKRQVAIKILPSSLAADTDRLVRFQREAEVLASLNHPHIAAIYGLEDADGVKALVMELVEGEDLTQRIARGPMPLDEALAIARQIAEALEAAHEQGIIHRDLKPANIKVRPDGTVKVLDFGLAKALAPEVGSAAAADLAQSPTMTSPAILSGVGMLLGTAAYMSPEQARGKPADKRSDVWAFGCVLYEMLTGRRTFEDEDLSLTLSNVLRREPDFDALPTDVPPSVRQTLRVCLQKDPRQRVQAMGDVRLAMQGAFETVAPRSAESSTAPALQVWQRPLPAALVVAAVAAAAALAVWGAVRRDPPAPRVARFEIALPPSETLALAATDGDLALSPDGTRVVYRVASAGRAFLAVRAIDELTARPLQGTDNTVYAPFISPDGAWVGFSDETDGTLKRVSILGGPVVRICFTGAGVSGIAGASWGEDGTIIFGTGTSGGLRRVAASGGEPEELTKLASGQTQHAWPEMLPGGRAVLFAILGGGTENAQIAVLDLETGRQRVLLTGGSYPRYSSTGHILYGIDGTLWAVPFDLKRLELTGTAVPVLSPVVTKLSGAADFAIALDGTLVYLSGDSGSPRRRLVWVDRMGREEPVPVPERAYQYPRISPDGRRVALQIDDQAQDIWTWDFAGQTLTRLTVDPALDTYPVWTPDGRRLIFSSTRAGAANLFWQTADGTGAVERLTESPNAQASYAITPDGSQILFREDGTTTSADIMLMPLQPPQRAQPLVQTMFSERNVEMAPDGRWLAYQSNESGRFEIYVRPFPDVRGGRWQVSTGGARTPLWSRNGQELFYLSAEGVVIGVRVDPGPSWRSSAPARVLQGQYFYSGPGAQRMFDITPDGRRFLMIKQGAEQTSAAPQIIVIQHWFEELKAKVPTR